MTGNKDARYQRFAIATGCRMATNLTKTENQGSCISWWPPISLEKENETLCAELEQWSQSLCVFNISIWLQLKVIRIIELIKTDFKRHKYCELTETMPFSIFYGTLGHKLGPKENLT